jgi:hypothetical protein
MHIHVRRRASKAKRPCGQTRQHDEVDPMEEHTLQ